MNKNEIAIFHVMYGCLLSLELRRNTNREYFWVRKFIYLSIIHFDYKFYGGNTSALLVTRCLREEFWPGFWHNQPSEEFWPDHQTCYICALLNAELIHFSFKRHPFSFELYHFNIFIWMSCWFLLKCQASF